MVIQEITSEKEWNELVLSISAPSGPHFLQSWQWGEQKSRHGWTAHRFAVSHSDDAIGAFQLLTRSVSKRAGLKVGYIPRGPVLKNPDALKDTVAAIAEKAREQNCFYVKADPEFEIGTALAETWMKDAAAFGFKYSPEQIQPRATGLSDLFHGEPNGEERLLAGMAKQWRYNVKLGPKRGIEIEPVANNDFEEFYKIYQETGARQGFGLRPREYYQEVADTFSEGNTTSAKLFVAKHPGEKHPLAGAFLLSFGKRWWYFYGASSARRRADMPTYALQWTSMKYARDHGGVSYDWWGAPEDPENKKDPRYSVWHFKKGFGPRHVLTVGAFDLPLKPVLYQSYMAAARFRKPLAKIRSKLSF